MKSIPLTLLSAALLLPTSLLHAADPAPPPDFRALFNGKDLTGWHGLNPHSVAKLQGGDRAQPLPAKGPIMLRTHGGEIRWRHIFVREIGSDEAQKILSEAAGR